MFDTIVKACLNTGMITKERVVEHFGSVAAVAEFFGIEVQAVYQWGPVIPELREAQLLLRLPDVFGKKTRAKAA